MGALTYWEKWIIGMNWMRDRGVGGGVGGELWLEYKIKIKTKFNFKSMTTHSI